MTNNLIKKSQKWFLAPKPNIKTITEEELDKYPEGEAIPSVCPPEGYGNHSCNDCQSLNQCPIVKYVVDPSQPNICSFYWPPNSKNTPTFGYWQLLNQIASEQESRG